jgi:hypothetical protein
MSFKETGNETIAGFIWLRVGSSLESFEPCMIAGNFLIIWENTNFSKTSIPWAIYDCLRIIKMYFILHLNLINLSWRNL